MLFDLSSPGRKNIIRVVYGVLALLFLVGFVGFGIGGELGGGGIIDSITGNNSSDDDASGRYPQIEDAENKLESDPTNVKALEDLAYYRALSGSQLLEADETTGQPVLTEESRGEYERAIEAWTRYLDAEKQPDPRVAGQVLAAYVFLGDAGGAAAIQEILVKEEPSFQNFASLAAYYYEDGDLKRGDAAFDRAEADAKPNDKPLLKQLEEIRAAAVKAKKEAGKQDAPAPGENPLADPFGSGLGAPAAP